MTTLVANKNTDTFHKPSATRQSLQHLFLAQKSYLLSFFDQFDLAQAEVILQAFLHCRGTIFFTGVGKSGIIAQKIAVTLCSTGSKASYMAAGDAMHGDLGIVTEHDIVVMLSKSGESEELLNLTPYIRNKGAKIIAWVSSKNSRLEKACDLVAYLHVQRELCSFDLAPTTSAEVQLIFGDVLTIALMRAKNFSLEEYAQNHPAGRIGRRASIKVKDLMLTGSKIPLCNPEDKLFDVLFELSNKSCGCILITDSTQKLLGIFTDGDLRRALQQHQESVLQKSMHSLMTNKPRYIKSDILAWEAMKAMEANPKKAITALPVIENELIIGLIRMHDLVQSGL